MLTRFGSSQSRTALLIKWGLILPLVLVLVAAIVIGARYISGKRRLDQLKSEIQSDPFGIRIVIEFDPVVPDWIRERVGAAWCNPLDRIKGIYIAGATDEDLIQRRGCFDVDSLAIESDPGSSWPTDRGLAIVGESRQIKRLEIRGGRYTQAGIRSLGNCRTLTELELIDVDLIPGWSIAIQQLRGLKELTVINRSAGHFNSQEVADLAAHPSLKAVGLDVILSKHATVELTPLPASPAGRTWHVLIEELNQEFVASLCRDKGLDTLSIQCDSLTNDALDPLVTAPSLRRLQLATFGPGFHEDQLSCLKECSKLEDLYIRGIARGPVGLKHLSALPALKEVALELELDPQDRQSLARLLQLRSLRYLLYYSRSGETIPDISNLKSLVNLEELDLGKQVALNSTNDILQPNLEIIRSMPKLHWLRFETYATVSNYKCLRELVENTDFPTVLKADFSRAIGQLEEQTRDPVLQGHTITLSIGQRVLLPKDGTMDPTID